MPSASPILKPSSRHWNSTFKAKEDIQPLQAGSLLVLYLDSLTSGVMMYFNAPVLQALLHLVQFLCSSFPKTQLIKALPVTSMMPPAILLIPYRRNWKIPMTRIFLLRQPYHVILNLEEITVSLTPRLKTQILLQEYKSPR